MKKAPVGFGCSGEEGKKESLNERECGCGCTRYIVRIFVLASGMYDM